MKVAQHDIGNDPDPQQPRLVALPHFLLVKVLKTIFLSYLLEKSRTIPSDSGVMRKFELASRAKIPLRAVRK